MHRRQLLRSLTATLGGAPLLIASGESPASSPARRGAKPRRAPGNIIEARDGTQLFVRDWGEGRPILFLSGWTLPSDVWRYEMVPLSESGMRCVAYDRRGHGRSSDPGRGYDYDTLADDLASVLDGLELSDVTIVAHSMGGGEAVRYLSRHGSKRVARLVLAGTTLPFLTKAPDNPDGVDASAFERLRRNALLKDFPKWLDGGGRPDAVDEPSAATSAWLKRLMLGTSMQAAIACHRILTATDFRAELAKVAVPTLIIHGDHDALALPAITALKVAQLLPGAPLKFYEGAGHGLFVTHAERLNEDLLAAIG